MSTKKTHSTTKHSPPAAVLSKNNSLAPQNDTIDTCNTSDVFVPSTNPKSKNCKFCSEEIREQSKVCHHCGRSQTWWKVHHLETGTLLGLGIAIVLAILSMLQFLETRRDRIKAETAVISAERALELAKLAQDNTKIANAVASDLKRLKNKLSFYSARQFETICRQFKGYYDANQLRCLLPDGTRLSYEDFSQ